MQFELTYFFRVALGQETERGFGPVEYDFDFRDYGNSALFNCQGRSRLLA